MLHFLRRMAESVVVRRQDPQTLQRELDHDGLSSLPSDVLVYAIEGPFFFAAVDAFQRALTDTNTDPRVLIIRLLHVPFIDATGLQVLEQSVLALQASGDRKRVVEGQSVSVRVDLGGLRLMNKQKKHKRLYQPLP